MPNYLTPLADVDKDSVESCGGKGASLGELMRAGFAVPAGFVIMAKAFDNFLGVAKMDEEINDILKKINYDDTSMIDAASEQIRTVIHLHPIPSDIAEEILKNFTALGAECVAVRSSATAEDSIAASWAGALETYLNVTKENILGCVRLCWSSLFTPRAIAYRHEHGLDGAPISVAVVIQAMVQSDVSGIAFTVHPVTKDPDCIIIEAGYGLGEAIVGGSITPDCYTFSKSNQVITNTRVNVQTKKLVKKTIHEWVTLASREGGHQKLTNAKIAELGATFKQVEDHYGFPCDIEWAIENGRLFITQTRPITTL